VDSVFAVYQSILAKIIKVVEQVRYNMEYLLMDSGQTIFIICQLVFGAVVTFLAIMLWSRTRDIAWMLIIIGVIVSYIEIVHSVLVIFGMGGNDLFPVGSVPLISFILPLLRMGFFIAGFLVMVIRQYKNK